MKTTTLQNTVLACALAWAGCGRTPLDDVTSPGTGGSSSAGPEAPTTSTASCSSSPSSGGGAGAPPESSASTSSCGGAGGGGGGIGGEGGIGGAGGSRPDFVANCAGVLDCPMLDGCAQWSYVVVDDGTTSDATATITVLQPAPLPPCTADVAFADADAGAPPTDVVLVPCGAQEWSVGLDRSTLTVYVNLEPSGLSWTPPCQ